jgi:hypothetical protein
LQGRSPCEKEYVEVQPTFPQKKKFKENKMSDKAEVPDKPNTSDKSKFDKVEILLSTVSFLARK